MLQGILYLPPGWWMGGDDSVLQPLELGMGAPHLLTHFCDSAQTQLG